MEGGMREPCVMRWPGHLPAGKKCDALASTIDLMPTFSKLAGTSEPSDRVIDGHDIRPLMFHPESAKTPHKAFFYYFRDQLQAVRSGKWKLHLSREQRRRGKKVKARRLPERLYDLDADIGEKTNVAAENPAVVKQLKSIPDTEKIAKSLTLYLDKIQNPGNFGTILRIADWFG